MGRTGNYKKGPWDDQLDGLMDMTACCSVAHEELEIAELLDHEMDRHQEQGYRYLRMIHREPDSPNVRAWAEAGLNAFGEAERLESLIEAHAHTADGKVRECNETSVELTQEADEHRREAAGIEKQGLTIPEAAARLGIGKSLTRELLMSGEIPGSVKMGRSRRVSKLVLDEWLASHHNGAEVSDAA